MFHERQAFTQGSLESLKKEAKRWFDALRQNIPDARTRYELSAPKALPKPTLREVQHALALENGFSGWTELKRKLTADVEETTRALGEFEDMASCSCRLSHRNSRGDGTPLGAHLASP